jgi:hypothetical protein
MANKTAAEPATPDSPVATAKPESVTSPQPQRTFEVVSIIAADGTDLKGTLGRTTKVTGPQPSLVVKKIMTRIYKENKQAVAARIKLSEHTARRGQSECTYDALVKKYNKKPSFTPSGSAKPVSPSFHVITQRVA